MYLHMYLHICKTGAVLISVVDHAWNPPLAAYTLSDSSSLITSAAKSER